MIYTLTVNPSLDHHIYMEKMTAGCVNRTAREKIRPGGKGINVSIMLKNLGIDSVALGFLGGYTGALLYKLLAEYGIVSDFVDLPGQSTRINVKIHAKEDTDINASGPLIRKADLKQIWEKLKHLDDGDFLVLSGNVPKSVPDTVYGDLMGRLAEKKIKVVVDASGGLLLNSLKERPFLVKPNLFELAEIFGGRPEEIYRAYDKEFVYEHGKKLREMGALNVLVSLGADGAVLFDECGNVHERCAPQGKQINSVGAGDSMIAGFLTGFLKTHDYDRALDYGVCAGSASAFSEEFASFDEIQRLMKTGEICGKQQK